MIPARFAPVLFGLILSGLMSAIVSAIATFRALERVSAIQIQDSQIVCNVIPCP